ncbi:MAG: 50S ribosomal protein L22 [Bdellovibrionota bacterium]|nr:50S ribosomal protein L22 [Deltaproteobacteria bacterium]
MTAVSTAKLRHLRVPPRKARWVADLIRGKNVNKAKSDLQFSDKKAARHLSALLNSAIANATQSGTVDPDVLFVKEIMVNEGPVLKRFKPRAQGRATRINKRTSHVTIVLGEK